MEEVIHNEAQAPEQQTVRPDGQSPKKERAEKKPFFRRETEEKKSGKATVIAAALIAVMVLAGIFLLKSVIDSGASALMDSYRESYESEKNTVFQSWYDRFFNKAEKEYHVSNRVAISIGEVRETAKLEVLKVSDTEYIIEQKDDNGSGITAWLEVPGEGTFVVDLQNAEFIIDDERAHVLVKAPKPELTNIAIDYANVEKLFFRNDGFNDSIRIGEDLARKQLSEADLLIKKEFMSNQHFYQSAQNAGRSAIEYLVRQFNPDLPDLTVEVEYF